MELSYDGVCFDLFGTLVTGDGQAIEGAKAALELLPDQRWAVVTSCGDGFARALIATAGLPMPKILVSAGDVARGKPAADPYVAGARRLRIDPSRLVVVEDSSDGITAGRAAGMDVIAIARGRGVSFARGAIAHVDRFAQIGWRLDENGSIRIRIEP